MRSLRALCANQTRTLAILLAGCLLPFSAFADKTPTPPRTTKPAAKKRAAAKKPAAKRSATVKKATAQKKPTPRRKAKAQPTLRKAPPARRHMAVLGNIPHAATHKQRSTRLMASQQAFGTALYKTLASKPGNLVFSPFSVATALSMLYAGAYGKTAVELYKGLRLPFYSDTLNTAYEGLLPQLNAPLGRPLKKGGKPTPPAFEISVANRIWTQKGFQLRKHYKLALEHSYNAGIGQLNFKDKAKALAAINKWVSKVTQQKIKKLLGPSSIKASTKMILTNAIYFKSAWKSKFHKKFTKPQTFWLDEKRKKQTPTMHQKNWFAHKDAGTHHVVKLQYYQQYASLYLLIPKKKAGLGSLEKTLSSTQLNAWLSGMRQRYLDLSLPKFKFTSKFSMADALGKLGIKEMFTARANLSKISKQKLQVGGVIHQAFLDVHEKGTEAAAATAVTFMLTAMPMKPPPALVIKADRPFMFVLRHEKTRTNLFIGRVVSP